MIKIRTLILLAFATLVSASLWAQDAYIQVELQQECVGGRSKIRVLPITPSTNVNDYTYEFTSFKYDYEDYLGQLVQGNSPNEFYVTEPPLDKFSHYTIKVKRAGYGDFSLDWYSTRCQHDNPPPDGPNPTDCPDNTRTVTPDKQYYNAGETMKLTYGGCPNGIHTYGTTFANDTPDKPTDYFNRLQISGGNALLVPVLNEPVTITVFCAGTGQCHGYTGFTLVPDGYILKQFPENTYMRIKAQGSGKYLVPGDVVDNVVQVSSTNDTWKFVKIEEPNVYKIISQMTDKALEATQSSGATSVRAQSNSEFQKWLVTFYKDGSFRLRPKSYSNSSLKTADESNDDGHILYFTNGNPQKSIDYFKFVPEFLSITTNDPGKLTYLPGDAVSVTYQTNFAPNKQNYTNCGFYDKSLMVLQLSDSQGSFNNPTSIGKTYIDDASGDASGKFTINGNIPAVVTQGSNYHLRVIRTQMERNPKALTNCTPSVKTVMAAYQEVYGSGSPQNIAINGSNICPPSLTVTDTFGQTGVVKEAEAITTTSTIMANAQVKMKASKVVDLQQGFDAQSSSNFDAQLDGCQTK